MNYLIQYPEDKATGKFEMFRYPGGEIQVRLTEKTAMELKSPIVETVTVVARITDGDIIPVAQLVDAIQSVTSAKVKLVLPYLPYSRADRRFTTGDSHGMLVFATILNTLEVDIVTLDCHSDFPENYVDRYSDISPNEIIGEVIDRTDGSAIYGTSIMTTAVLLPDKGAARYGYNTRLIAEKTRDPQTGKLSGFTVPQKFEFDGADNILIIDDICDGGGTFIGIAQALRSAGVNQKLFLYVTHGIFSKGTAQLRQYFNHVYTTDSFRSAESYGEPDFITVLPCLPTILGENK